MAAADRRSTGRVGLPADGELLAVAAELELPHRHLVVGAEQLPGARVVERHGAVGLSDTDDRAVRAHLDRDQRPFVSASGSRSARGSSTTRPAGWPVVSVESSRRTPSTASSSEWSRSSTSSAWAPTRRASAATAERSARFACRTAISAGDERRPPATRRRRRARRAAGGSGGPAGGAAPRSVAASARSRSALASRKLRSVGVRSGLARVCHSSAWAEANAAVELAVGPAHGIPGVGGEGEVAEDALALDVVVQPGLQTGPGPGE